MGIRNKPIFHLQKLLQYLSVSQYDISAVSRTTEKVRLLLKPRIFDCPRIFWDKSYSMKNTVGGKRTFIHPNNWKQYKFLRTSCTVCVRMSPLKGDTKNSSFWLR